MVTVSTAKNKFATGFDLKWVKPDPVRGISVYAAMLNVWRRIATFPMPTFCVINGHAFAGGLILALCHDFRTMVDSDRVRLKLSEIDLGMYLPVALSVLLKQTLTTQARRPLEMGQAMDVKNAKKLNIVTASYGKPEEADSQIAKFADQFAEKGVHKQALKLLKTRMFQEFVDQSQRNSHSTLSYVFNSLQKRYKVPGK